MKAVQQTYKDTDEYHHEYVYFASMEGGIDFKIDVESNGKPVDTGCARTLLPKRWFRDNIGSPLKQSNAKFSAFGGGELNCLGTFEANVKCKNQGCVEPVFVIDVYGPPLLGRTAIQALNLVKIYAVGDGPSIERECILQEYEMSLRKSWECSKAMNMISKSTRMCLRQSRGNDKCLHL